MKNKLFIAFILYSLLSCQEKKTLNFKALNPPYQETKMSETAFIPKKWINKKSRVYIFGIEGFSSRDSNFDNSLNEFVNEFSKHIKIPLLTMYFYNLNSKISVKKKYNLSNLIKHEGRDSCISIATFENGKLIYFVYVEDEKILYNYLTNEKMDEIYE